MTREELDEREAAVLMREERVGCGMDSDVLIATMEALPNGNGTANNRAVRNMFLQLLATESRLHMACFMCLFLEC